MKVTYDNQYANQRPFKNLSIGVIIGILIIGLILLSVSAQAAGEKNDTTTGKMTNQLVDYTQTTSLLH